MIARPIAQLVACILFFGFFLYSYVDKQNSLTGLKMRIPEIARDIKAVKQECKRLQYEIDRFESPENLLALAREERFSHLKHPYSNEIALLAQGPALNVPQAGTVSMEKTASNLFIAFGAKPE